MNSLVALVALASGQGVAAPVPANQNAKIIGWPNEAEKNLILAEADIAYQRFYEYFNTKPDPITVDLRPIKSIPPESGLLYLPWLSDEQLYHQIKNQVPSAFRQQAMDQVRQQNPMSHEVGHILLLDYSAKRAKQVPPENLKVRGSYGSPFLPDWVDEMFAIICEKPAIIDIRIHYARQGVRIPLDTLLTMKHPVLPGAPPPGGTGTVVTVTVNGSDGEQSMYNLKLAEYYSNVAAFWAFLKLKAGSSILKKIVDAFIDGKEMNDVLAMYPTLPQTVDKLDEAWKTWMRSRL